MSMLRRRMRRSGFVRPAAAAVCVLCVLGAAQGAMAASHDILHDVPGYFSYMSNVEGEIRSYHAAVDGLAQAKIDLENARHNLAEARTATADAANNLVLVGQNLRAVEDHLAAVRIALSVAEEASAARTAEAIAAQQAEADYVPQVYARRAQVNALSAQESRIAGASTPGSTAWAERAAVVERVLSEVGYEQNRIEDAQIMVEAALAGGNATGGTPAGSSQIDAITAQIAAAQAALDAVEAHLDALTAAREMAEDAERDARALVADYQQELTASTADLAQLRSDQVEAENYDAEAKKWASEAARDEVTAQKQLVQSEHELKYLGEGKGYQTGLEYYAWHGDHAGHQLYLPFSYFARTHAGKTKLDYGLSTGYLKSDTGYENGSVSGWTDTQLSVTLRNEKPVNSVFYGLAVSMPTGQSKIYQRSTVPEGLARFTDFGAGWQVTPSIEVTHKITERDRLTARVSYNIRNGYDYAKESDVVKRLQSLVQASGKTAGTLIKEELETYLRGVAHMKGEGFLSNAALAARLQKKVEMLGKVEGELTDADKTEIREMVKGLNDELHFFDISLGRDLTYNDLRTLGLEYKGLRKELIDRNIIQQDENGNIKKGTDISIDNIVLDSAQMAHTSPGNIFSQEIEYLHAGEKKQYMVQFYHNSTSQSSQYAILPDNYYYDLAQKQLHLGWKKIYYRDGDDWELRFFHNRQISKKDELRFYSIYALTEAASGIASQSVARQYYGLGLRHRVSPKLAWLLMAHYSDVSSTSDPLRTALNTGGGFKRKSLVAGVEWKITERKNFTFQAERYVRSDDGGFGYNGWGVTFWYQETL